MKRQYQAFNNGNSRAHLTRNCGSERVSPEPYSPVTLHRLAPTRFAGEGVSEYLSFKDNNMDIIWIVLPNNIATRINHVNIKPDFSGSWAQLFTRAGQFNQNLTFVRFVNLSRFLFAISNRSVILKEIQVFACVESRSLRNQCKNQKFRNMIFGMTKKENIFKGCLQ